MAEEFTYVGIDVAKDRVDGATRPPDQNWTAERLRLAASKNRDLAVLQEMHRGQEEQRGGRYSGVDAQMAGGSAHMLLWHSGAALLSILGVIYPCARRWRWPAWCGSTTGAGATGSEATSSGSSSTPNAAASWW